MQRAMHSRFFRLIYSSPKQTNNFRCIIISIYIIYFAICVSAFKYLINSFPNIFTIMTRLRSICRINYNQLNSIKQTLVFKFLSQIIKRPFTKFTPKLLISSFRSKSDISQIFNSNSFTLLFSRRNNGFTNGMINYVGSSSFTSTYSFKQFSRITSAFTLNRTTKFLSFFSILINKITSVFNSIRCNCNICQSKINTYKFFNIINIFIRNINCLKQKEFIVFINQVCFAFNIRKVFRIMTNKWYFLTTTYRPNRENIILFISKNSTIIRDRTKWFKIPFRFLINFIGVGYFRDCSYKNLCTKFRRRFKIMITSMMNFVLIKYLFFPNNIRDIIANGISFFDSIYKRFCLNIVSQKFYFKSKFHTYINTNKNQKVSSMRKNIINNFNYGMINSEKHSSHPHFVMNGFPVL